MRIKYDWKITRRCLKLHQFNNESEKFVLSALFFWTKISLVNKNLSRGKNVHFSGFACIFRLKLLQIISMLIRKKRHYASREKTANYNQDWKSNKVVECYITTLAQFKIENCVFSLHIWSLGLIISRWLLPIARLFYSSVMRLNTAQNRLRSFRLLAIWMIYGSAPTHYLCHVFVRVEKTNPPIDFCSQLQLHIEIMQAFKRSLWRINQFYGRNIINNLIAIACLK